MTPRDLPSPLPMPHLTIRSRCRPCLCQLVHLEPHGPWEWEARIILRTITVTFQAQTYEEVGVWAARRMAAISELV